MGSSRRKPVPRASRRRREPDWAELPTAELLDVRLCDLGVRIEGSVLQERIDQALGELERRDIAFQPHLWVAEEWFTPQGVPGCAVPFYLLHPRLTRLERGMMLAAEGADRQECLKILRHEFGHAIDHAYRLNLRRTRHRLFGKSSTRYPTSYLPRPFSRSFVRHLDCWYAQAHPDEDFAETFAVWLRPRPDWRTLYQGWPALRKLEYMDELMQEIAGAPARVRSRRHVDPIRGVRKTLREYYAEKQEHYLTEFPRIFDADLRKLFSDAPEHGHRETAAAFLRRVRPRVRRMVARWTGHYEYMLDHVLRDVIGRCRELGLHVAGPARRAEMDATVMLTVNIVNFVYTGRRRLDL